MRKKPYSKSRIDKYYHLKHLGAWIGTFALVLYDKLSSNYPATKQEWVLFWLIIIAYIFGATNSLMGSKRISG